MDAIGLGLIFAGYGIAFTGYMWLKGYDVTLTQVWSPIGYYRGAWPPPKIPADQLFPV